MPVEVDLSVLQETSRMLLLLGLFLGMSFLTRLSAKFAEVPGNGSHVKTSFLGSSLFIGKESRTFLRASRRRKREDPGNDLSRAIKMAS